jgi:hypothetical protein
VEKRERIVGKRAFLVGGRRRIERRGDLGNVFGDWVEEPSG